MARATPGLTEPISTVASPIEGQVRRARHVSGGEQLENEIRPIGTSETPAGFSSVPTGRIQLWHANPALKRRAILKPLCGTLDFRMNKSQLVAFRFSVPSTVY